MGFLLKLLFSTLLVILFSGITSALADKGSFLEWVMGKIMGISFAVFSITTLVFVWNI